MKKEERIIQGRKNRASGLAFERKVRLDLEKKGWIVSKWQNNIEFRQIEFPVGSSCGFEEGKCVPALMGRFRTNQNGFPDFICYKKQKDSFDIIFVEVKKNGYLKPEEKEKANWYLNNNYCSTFLIASLLNKNISYKTL